MRSSALYCMVILGVSLYSTRIQAAPCNKVKLTNRNYGESWNVNADEHPLATNALRSSPPSEFVFNSSVVQFYDILFSERTSVERLWIQVENMDDATVEVYQEGSTVADQTQTKTTGSADWSLERDAYIVHLHSVRKIRITWTTDQVKAGIKRLVVVVCDAGPCEPDKVYDTMPTLALPPGFGITVPGPPLGGSLMGFGLEPADVLDGSESQIMLRDITEGTNYISMTFATEVRIRTFQITLRHAKGMIIQCFRDIAGTDLVYEGTETFNLENWKQVEKRAMIGQITKIKRVDIKVMYDPSMSDKLVFAKELTFHTCK